MQLGMIGLGRMGGNIVRRLMKHGHTAVVYDKDPKAVAAIAADGALGSLLAGVFGYQDMPSVGEVALYLLYLVPALALLTLGSFGRAPAKPRALAPQARHRRVRPLCL